MSTFDIPTFSSVAIAGCSLDEAAREGLGGGLPAVEISSACAVACMGGSEGVEVAVALADGESGLVLLFAGWSTGKGDAVAVVITGVCLSSLAPASS